MNQVKRIFVVGHYGAGKGLLAQKIAEFLGWRLVDADLGLESQIGCHLHEILGEQGQFAFYDCQFNILTALCTQEQLVIITDSSVVGTEKNRQLLKHEVVIWLDVSIPVQIERTLRNSAFLLPMLCIENFLAQLHATRDNFYQEVAKLTIQGDDSEVEKHVVYIIKTIFGKKITAAHLKSTLKPKDYVLFHKQLHTPVHLSVQQAIYLKFLAQGKTAKEIAREVHISYRTIEGTIAKLIEKLGCMSSKELIALYHEKP